VTDPHLPPRYNPEAVEDRTYEAWETSGAFHSEPGDAGETYTIVIPPPNVTGVLHMGHALNNVIQDTLVRWRRMQGCNTLWLPGTDHAGIATQNVVERGLADEGLSRFDLGREKFVARAWAWKEQYGDRILGQLKRLGASCDWARTRFTMDDGLSRAVGEAFSRLYAEGLIYRGNRIIHWCPRCGTALADDEVEHKERQGKLWHIRYPAAGGAAGGGVVVATTRPETLLGDTAVAVHPDDERYKRLVGKMLRLPLQEREIPVVADEAVDPAFGTGAVKVTPAHDAADFEIGQRHGLEAPQILDGSARMTEAAGERFQGLDRFLCRDEVVAALEEAKLLEKVEPYTHSVGRCYRCGDVVEALLSEQWFVKMKPLAKTAIEATRSGRVKFHPERWTRVYLSWLENVRDWCISRQIWWGHRIPVWTCAKCGEIAVATEAPGVCPTCGAEEIAQDEDVLDTWFSSSLWPFSTLGWPEETEELDAYYPTRSLVTDRGIIYFWVARMVMMGLKMVGNVPFRDVYIHGTVLDEQGRKMSKSLGNGIDPIEMIERFGADAVRFSLIVLTTEGQDVKLSPTKFEMGRNFANKVWNAARLVLARCAGDAGSGAVPDEDLAFEDRWILSRLAQTVRDATGALEAFRFHDAAQAIYGFFWRDYCDWYLEHLKFRLRREGPGATRSRASAARTALHVLDRSLRLLHPIIPFVTEEIWSHLGAAELPRELDGGRRTGEAQLVRAAWPEAEASRLAPEIEAEMAGVQALVRAVRNIRAKVGLEAREKLPALVSVADESRAPLVTRNAQFLGEMANLERPEVEVNAPKPEGAATEVLEGMVLYVPLAGLRDTGAERKRLEGKLAKQEAYLAKLEAQLANGAFLEKAKKEVVAGVRASRAEALAKIEKLRETLAGL